MTCKSRELEKRIERLEKILAETLDIVANLIAAEGDKHYYPSREQEKDLQADARRLRIFCMHTVDGERVCVEAGLCGDCVDGQRA